MTRRVMGGALLALIVGGMVLAAVLASVVIAKGALIEDDRQATTYLVSGRADIPVGQVHDDVMVARGVVTVDGIVEGDVIVGSGRVRVNGVVHGDVVVLRGGARLGPGARIDGDLQTSQPPRLRDGASVGGDIEETNPLAAPGLLPDAVWFVLWLAAGLAVLVVGLLAPRPVADAARSGAGRPTRALVVGGAVAVLVPLAVGLLALSLLGAGVAVVLGGAFAIATAVGAAAVGLALGRLAGLPEGRLAFVAGWGAIGVVLAIALLASPLLALFGAFLVAALGLGALVPARGSAPYPTEQSEDESPPTGEPEEEALLAVFERLEAEPADDEPQILAAFPIASGSRN